MKAQYGIDSMPETAENVAAEFQISRADQDAFALRSQQRAARRPGERPLRRGDRSGDDPARARASPSSSTRDEHPRETTLEALAKLKAAVPRRTAR